MKIKSIKKIERKKRKKYESDLSFIFQVLFSNFVNVVFENIDYIRLFKSHLLIQKTV